VHKFRFQVSGFRFLQAAVIAAACWFVYSPAFHGDWFWDDPSEITTNLALHNRTGLWKIWFAPDSPDYYPLKTTLQWVQWHLWGDNVTGYHLTNVGLHLLSALLLWHLLRKLGVGLAWLGGLIFAIHPLAVESVAWISELKNVLSLPFLLLAMIFWLDWDNIRWSELPSTRLFGSDGKKTRTTFPMKRIGGNPLHLQSSPNEARSGQHAPPFYLLSLLCFLASMLSKSSVVMFPFVLLLYAWWKRGRIDRRDVLATAPFFAVALVLGLVTFWFQQNVAIKGIVVPQGGFWSRLAVAGMAVVFYVGKFVWPVGLLPIYPRWAADPPALWQFWPWVVIGVVAFSLWRWSELPLTRLFGSDGEKNRTAFPMKRIRGNPLHLRSPNANEARSGQHAPPAMVRHLLFGLGFFLINLLPVLGFVPMSFLRLSWVADHFAYLPMIGLVGLTAAVISNFEFRISKFGSIVIGALLAALAITARQHATIFESEKAVWTYTLARNPQAWLAHNNLSNILLNEGRLAEAKEQIDDALRIKPDFAEANNNLGNILLQMDRPEEAKLHFEAAIRFRENYAEARNGLGNYYLKTGQPAQALECYEQALRINPDYTDCRDNLGAALEDLGRVNEAIAEYGKVLRVKPGFASAHYNLGIALAKLGDFPRAIAQYKLALRIDPRLVQAYNNLGNAEGAMRRPAEAISAYEQALQLNPGFFEVHLNLGNALFYLHRVPESIVQFEAAVRLQPNYAPGHNNLGISLQAVGRASEAKAQFEEALRLNPNYTEARRNLVRLEFEP